MANTVSPFEHEKKTAKIKGSLTRSLVRTLLLFTLIPLALMAGGAYIRARGLLEQQSDRHLKSLLSNQAGLIEQHILYKHQLLQDQLSNPNSENFLATPSLLDSSLLANNEGGANGFSHYIVLSNAGDVLLASERSWQGAQIEFSPVDGSASESILLGSFPPFIENEPVLVSYIRYASDDGKKTGMLIGLTSGDELKNTVQPLIGLDPYSQAFIASSEGELILIKETGEYISVEAENSSTEKIGSIFTKKTDSPVKLNLSLIDGERYLAQGEWVPALQGVVILAVSSEIVYADINSLAPFTIALFAGSLIAMGIVLYFGVQQVVRPLQSLLVVTKKFSEGDREARASELNSNNEIYLLGKAFNRLAEQIEGQYHLLEQKVEERTLQVRTAAEVAQSINNISNIDEMMQKTVELLVQQFNFYQSSIFLLDRSGKNIELKCRYGSVSQRQPEQKYSQPVTSDSLIGWVAIHNKPRIASDLTEEELHLTDEILPETRSEACVPIALGDYVLGVLDIQSTQPGDFGPDSLIMLQTLASQLATAMQTNLLVETSQVNFKELDRLYRSSRLIADARTKEETLRVSEQIVKGAPYPVLLLEPHEDRLSVTAIAGAFQNEVPDHMVKNGIHANTQDIASYLAHGTITISSTSADAPRELKDLLRGLGMLNGVFIPVQSVNVLEAVLFIGSRQKSLSAIELQPYENLADLMSVTLQRVQALSETEKHLKEVEAIASINELTASASDVTVFYSSLHSKIQQIIGDYNLIVALYNVNDNTIHIPFSYELGKIQSIPPFPLGEGLTSILLKTRQPLMLVKDTEKKSAELGAKIVGKPAKSWLGAPLIVQGEVIGALIIQDVENEGAFDEDDLKFFTTITGQVAGVIKNTQLIEETKKKAIQVEAAAEIARDINGYLNLDELLYKAVNLIREHFNFYHAGIFLLDQPREFAVVREATGEAGIQMKRQGYKIGVGSKSIVGYASGKGEALIISDTTKDVTYYPNPLLPETKAEAAIPLKVSDRVLGILDVQSTTPYAFTEDNMKSLGILADQLAIAVENSELFAETQEHLSQHRLLHHITSSAASGTTLEEALESAVSGLQVTLGGDRVIIMLLDHDKKTLEVKASIGYAEDISKMRVEIGQGVTGWAAAHRRPLRLRDVHEDPRYIETSPNTKSELAIPLVYRNEILGVINVESEQTDAYSENDEEMLGTLGGSLAAIIANARLLEQIRAQSERERLINEISTKIRRSTDIQSILHTTVSEIVRVTGAKHTKIQIKPNTAKLTDEEG